MQRDVLIVNRRFPGINPLTCGEEQCVPGHEFGPAVREYTLLHYVISGKGVFRKGEESHRLGKGQIFVIHPHEITTYTADLEQPWHYNWIGFDCNLALNGLLDVPVITAPRAEYLFRSMLEGGDLHASRELYLCAKLFELLSLLEESRMQEAGPVPQYILKAKNYIETTYMEEISVGRIAAYLNLDRSYFSTAFKKSTGKSPQQYIVDFRLEKAAELISLHGYRPGEAGQSVGYPDIFHFSRMFKRRFGLSPTAYTQKRK